MVEIRYLCAGNFKEQMDIQAEKLYLIEQLARL